LKAYIFPGQGSQFAGMGKELYENNIKAKKLFERANEFLGFRITDIMFSGTDEHLKQTKVTQPAVFLHSVILALSATHLEFPSAVAGHSLGEFSALVVNKTLNFEDGLKLVSLRALAMQEACELKPSTMSAVIGLSDEKVEQACALVTDDIVVPANYNCPGQLVVSGTLTGIEKVTPLLKEAGAKRVLALNVAGAFHSPLMEPARQKLEAAIAQTDFHQPVCPIYQNVNALPVTDSEKIKQNLIQQLTAPVRWTQSVQNMANDGIAEFFEIGPGTVLQGLVKKINQEVVASSLPSSFTGGN
jgi:[acyl-carrier-protein] S-malonyltransferase